MHLLKALCLFFDQAGTVYCAVQLCPRCTPVTH